MQSIASSRGVLKFGLTSQFEVKVYDKMPAYDGKMVANARTMVATRTYMRMIMVVRTCMTGAESSGRKPV